MLKTFLPSNLYGQSFGTKTPKVLMLHGWQRSSNDFSKIGALLESNYSISSVAIDLPGFGVSDYSFSKNANENDLFVAGSLEYAKKLSSVIQSEFDNFIILGHSFGGRVAIRLANIFPNQVMALVLTGVPLISNPNSKKTKQNKLLKTYKTLNRLNLMPETKVEKLRLKYGSLDYRNATRELRNTLVKVIAETNEGVYLDELSRSQCTVKLVWGDSDTEIPVEVAKKSLEAIEHADITLKVVAEASHMLPLEKPELFADMLASLVAESG